LGDGIQHWLDIGRRAGNDPQDLGGGRLLLERLRPIAGGVGCLAAVGGGTLSGVSGCCSSDSVNSRVRSSTLRSRPAYDSLSWPAMLLNWSASASSSAHVRTRSEQ